MAVITDATLVNGGTVTPIDPASAQLFLIVGQPGSVEQVNPSSPFPVPDPFNPGQFLDHLGGIVVAISANGLEGTVTATQAQAPTSDPVIDLNQPVALLVYTFEQPDGSQLVVRTSYTQGEGPTLQEVLDGGYRFDDMMADVDTLNGSPFTPPFQVVPVIGTSGDDSIPGDLVNPDSIDGGDGDDTIDAGHGDNTIMGGTGADSITTGDGHDSIDAGRNQDWVWAGNGDDFIKGGGGGDYLHAGYGNDTVIGGTWNDQILGSTGDDFLFGNRHNDTLNGGADNDYLNGGGDDDVLIGGLGNDLMHGGSGADEFSFGHVDQEFGNDTIDDFHVGVDQLTFANPAADGMTAQQLVDGATVTAQGVLITVGTNTLLLEGLVTTDGLVDSIVVEPPIL